MISVAEGFDVVHTTRIKKKEREADLNVAYKKVYNTINYFPLILT